MGFCEINYTEWRTWEYVNQWGEGDEVRLA